MSDLLVNLLTLPELATALELAGSFGFEVRRALAPEKHLVIRWVQEQFSASWSSECEIAFARQPVSCFIATKEKQICGFAAYEATCRNFFGPLGVETACQGHHVGEALLLSALHAMRAEGYAYAIIGGVGPVEFFTKTVGATLIEGSQPGIYRGMLK
jgi:hypothetical protein